jgi:hypothetical protein
MSTGRKRGRKLTKRRACWRRCRLLWSWTYSSSTLGRRTNICRRNSTASRPGKVYRCGGSCRGGAGGKRVSSGSSINSSCNGSRSSSRSYGSVTSVPNPKAQKTGRELTETTANTLIIVVAVGTGCAQLASNRNTLNPHASSLCTVRACRTVNRAYDLSQVCLYI